MCVYSMVVDHYHDKWWKDYVPHRTTPSQEEIDEFYELLRRAREYDETHNQPDCGIEDKKEAMKKVADALGVEIDFPDG